MKKFLGPLLGLILISLTACDGGGTANAATLPEPSTVDPQASLYIGVSTNDLDRGMMALRMANTMLDKNHKTIVYLNIEGVQIASTKIPQHTHGMFGKSLQTMLKELIDKGATVAVCPVCMERLGISQEDLIPGVILSSPDFSFDAVMDSASKTMYY